MAAEEQQQRERREREAAARRKENSSANASVEVKQKLQVHLIKSFKFWIQIITNENVTDSISGKNMFQSQFGDIKKKKKI